MIAWAEPRLLEMRKSKPQAAQAQSTLVLSGMDIVALPEVRQTRVRYLIIAILFAVSCFRFGDRVALSLAGAAVGKAINLTPVRLGYLFSAFSWAYVLGQLVPAEKAA